MVVIIKIVVIGDRGSGKYDLFEQEEVIGQFYTTHGFQPYTITRQIEDRQVRFQSWILNPDDRFKKDRETHYIGTLGALIIFNVSKPETFQSVDKWIHEIWNGAGNDIPIVIMGNRDKGLEEDEGTTTMVYEYLKDLMINEGEGIMRMVYVENSLDDKKGFEDALTQLGLEYFYYLEKKQ